MAADFLGNCAATHIPAGAASLGSMQTTVNVMTSKYYTHFVADVPEAPHCGEYTGVVEMPLPLRQAREINQLSAVLAENFDLRREDIRILHWALLH
jgi:hypothetical protein